jgi:hypothetical protein
MKKRNVFSSILMVLFSVLLVPVAQAQAIDDPAADSVNEPNYTPLDENAAPSMDGEDSIALEPEQRWRDCDRWGRDRWGRRCDNGRDRDCDRWGRDRWGRRCDNGRDRDCDRWGRDRWGRRCDGRGDRGQFSVRRYPISGREVVDCQDYRIGGRRFAQLVTCVDIGDGRNHGCYAVSQTACLAWEGSGNRGSAGCIAYCRGGF